MQYAWSVHFFQERKTKAYRRMGIPGGQIDGREGLARFLFGVSPFDLPTFASVAAVLLVAGVAATFFPAWRATKVDPMVALRVE